MACDICRREFWVGVVRAFLAMTSVAIVILMIIVAYIYFDGGLYFVRISKYEGDGVVSKVGLPLFSYGFNVDLGSFDASSDFKKVYNIDTIPGTNGKPLAFYLIVDRGGLSSDSVIDGIVEFRVVNKKSRSILLDGVLDFGSAGFRRTHRPEQLKCYLVGRHGGSPNMYPPLDLDGGLEFSVRYTNKGTAEPVKVRVHFESGGYI